MLPLLPWREGSFGLALALQARGRTGDGDEALAPLVDALQKTGNTHQLALVDALRARLALIRGDVEPVRRWLQTTDSGPAQHWLHAVTDAAPLTRAWARLRLALEAPASPAALEAVLRDIDALVDSAASMHMTKRQVEALALRVLALDALGERAAALESLARAIDLADPGGLVRPFADLGPSLAGLLRRLVATRPPSKYLERVLAAAAALAVAAAPAALLRHTTPAGDLVEHLTDREVEVLQRLARRLSNKEIAGELHVSVETVKRHAANIYAKLGASSRWRAVDRATDLGLLPPA